MGEIADSIIYGLLCQDCGAYIDGDEPGFPRSCPMCAVDDDGSIGPRGDIGTFA